MVFHDIILLFPWQILPIWHYTIIAVVYYCPTLTIEVFGIVFASIYIGVMLLPIKTFEKYNMQYEVIIINVEDADAIVIN